MSQNADPYGTVRSFEDCRSWSTEKFRRLIERFMEGEHMASNEDTYQVYHNELVFMKEAFERLHPRSYRNWLETHEFRADIERLHS